MGLGRLLTRNITYDVTNSQTGETATYTVITDGGPGMYPGWSIGSNYRGAMAIPVAWRLSLMIANQIGRVPFQAFREVSGRPPVKLVPTPSLLARPIGKLDTGLGAFRSWTLDRLWHGNGIGLVTEYSSLGWPTAAVPVDAEFVQVKMVAENDPVAPRDFVPGELAYLIGTKWHHQRDVIHFKGPCKPGALRGMGILEEHFEMMSRSRKLDAAATAVDSGAVPTGVLKSLNPDMTQAEATALKNAWKDSQTTRSVAVLNPLTDFVPIAWNPTETQLLEARQYTLTEWSNIFGVPMSYAGAANSSRVYSNVEDQGNELLKFGTVGDIIAEFEATLTEMLPRGSYVKANVDHLLRNDTKSRYEAHAIAISSGFKTRDEVRELEELPPLTDAQKAELQAMSAPAPPANNTPGSGEAPPRLAAVRELAFARAIDRAAEIIAEAAMYDAERGYPEFNQHQPRYPKGTGKKAGEWTDRPGGRAPFGAKGAGTWSKGEWVGFDQGVGSFGGSNGSGGSAVATAPAKPKGSTAGGETVEEMIPSGDGSTFFSGQGGFQNLPGAAAPLGSGPGFASGPPMGMDDVVSISPSLYSGGSTRADKLASAYSETLGGRIPKSESMALRSYTGSGYTSMNESLWSGHPRVATPQVQRNIDNLNNLISRYQLPETVTAVRGLSKDPNLPPFGSAVGQTYTAEGFQSTSIGDGAFTGKSVVMNITVPKGTNAAIVNGTGLGLAHEEEMILPHGTRYVITSDVMKGGKRVLDVTALPPE